MSIRLKYFFLAMLCCLGETAAAQHYLRSGSTHRRTKAVSPVEAIGQRYQAKFDSLVTAFSGWKYPGEDVLSNPYYATLMGSPTLYSGTLHRTLGLLPADSALQRTPMLPSSERAYSVEAMSDKMLIMVYATAPWLVLHEEAEEGTMNVENKIREGVKPEMSLTERFAGESEKRGAGALHPALDDDLDILVRKPNFWTFKTILKLQFMQNHVSDNWYKGGESNNSLLAEATVEANYNNQRKVTFDNKLEMRLGFQTSENDEKHKYKTNSDLLRLTNKIGLKAFKNWYYTATLQSWTQFYPGYKANDTHVYSDFMSPFESLLSVGMDYKFSSKNGKFNINASLSPIGLKLKYVDRSALATSFGLTEGHHAKWDRGSNVTVNCNWNFMKNVSWKSRLYYFTDYSKSTIEWENTFSFTINKYLSGSLFLYPRFDDSRKRKEDESYFQFYELLSFGLTYSF
ncbi:MAG: DUF3078 domain-containing protein [Alloprevotella sp.]|nr:DUF3078 domain-containing protein [Alloprevotella sp.]